jgi:TonB family protein
VVDRAHSSEIPLNLLLDLREPDFRRRVTRAAIGSVLAHLAIVPLLLSMLGAPPRQTEIVIAPDVRRSVSLVAPPPKEYEPTQTAPNKGKVTRELDVRSSLEATPTNAPRVQPSAPSPGRAATPQPAPAAPPVQIAEAPRPEPPRVEPSAPPPAPVTGSVPDAVPPATKQKPKLAFESVESNSVPKPNPLGSTITQLPKNPVEEAMKSAARKDGGGGVTLGAQGGFSAAPQLLSDPKGVDFRPYLIQVVTAVRRNWFAVMPESARMGRRGTVLIQFIIDKRGGVPKLVIADSSGIEAFDRAAVAGVSASTPFLPLPAEYKGDQIRLQLAFTYNGQPIR